MAGAVPENVIVIWPGTHSAIPDNWTRETGLDSKMSKGVANASTDAGGTGGGSSHVHASASHTHTEPSHTHTGTAAASVQSSEEGAGSAGSFSGSPSLHGHTFSTGAVAGPTSGGTDSAWASTAIEPAYYEVIYIKSDGDGDGFPDDSIVYFNSGTDPSDWTQHSASVDKFFRGAGTGGNGGGTGGSATHTHTGGSHTHSIGNHTHGTTTTTGQTTGYASGNSGMANNDYNHPHAVSATNSSGSGTSGSAASSTSATANNTPPATKMNAIQNDSGSSVWLEGAYCLWVGDIADIPESFTIADGNNSTRNLLGRFILNEPANNSGHGDESGSVSHGHTTASHTHTSSHGHTGTAVSSYLNLVVQNRNATGGDRHIRTHAHPTPTIASGDPGLAATSPTLTTNSDAQPSFKSVAYIMSGEEPAVGGGSAIMFGASF